MDYTQGIVEQSCLIFSFNFDTDGFGLFRHDVSIMYGLLFVKNFYLGWWGNKKRKTPTTPVSLLYLDY
jgi:hypothetical protein